MTLKDPAKLRERDTNYGFLRFWETDTAHDESYTPGMSASSAPDIRSKKDLQGLARVCRHWTSRGNSLYQVPLKNLIAYVAENDQTFSKRVSGTEIPEISAKDWVKEIYAGNATLRKQIGLEK